MNVSDDIIVRKIDSELFVYNRERSLIHTFNESGVFIWELIEKGYEKDKVIDVLVHEYAVDVQTATKDVDEFMQILIKYEMVGE